MPTDRYTKAILTLIAAALCAIALRDLVHPPPVAAMPDRVQVDLDHPVEIKGAIEVKGSVETRGTVEIKGGQVRVDGGSIVIDTFSKPIHVLVEEKK